MENSKYLSEKWSECMFGAAELRQTYTQTIFQISSKSNQLPIGQSERQPGAILTVQVTARFRAVQHCQDRFNQRARRRGAELHRHARTGAWGDFVKALKNRLFSIEK